MSRNRKNRRGGPRRGSTGGPTLVWGLIAATSFACVAFAAWYVVANKAVPLDARNCPPGAPPAATLVVLDLTDTVDPSQMQRIRHEIEQEVEAALSGTLIAVGTVRPAGTPSHVFAACKPPDGANASQFTEQPRRIKAKYESTFLAPLNAELDAMAAVPEAASSPIMEAIQATIAHVAGWTAVTGPRRLILASDLLQHSQAFSLYGNRDWNDFRNTPDYTRLSRNLEDVEVRVLRLPRPRARVADRSAVDDFWANYFDRQGARPPRVQTIGDL